MVFGLLYVFYKNQSCEYFSKTFLSLCSVNCGLYINFCKSNKLYSYGFFIHIYELIKIKNKYNSLQSSTYLIIFSNTFICRCLQIKNNNTPLSCTEYPTPDHP